jgi:hypothetical protein
MHERAALNAWKSLGVDFFGELFLAHDQTGPWTAEAFVSGGGDEIRKGKRGGVHAAGDEAFDQVRERARTLAAAAYQPAPAVLDDVWKNLNYDQHRDIRFTMDEGLSDAVQKVFVDLYREDLIYRGNRIINWCPRADWRTT